MIERIETAEVSRRSMIRAAAWSLPVIALAVATPAAAASIPGDLELAFGATSYTGAGCATLASVAITVTRGGLSAAGVPVTVTLPDGLTWTDGTASARVLTSSGTGEVVLTALQAPANTGIYTVSASAESIITTARVTITGAVGTPTAWQNYRLTSLDRNTTFANVPSSATPLGNNYFFADNTLYWGNDRNVGGLVVATGVAEAIAFHGNDGDYASAYVGGRWVSYAGNSVSATYASVPSSATALENNYFLDGTTLWFKNTVVSTSVVNARGWHGGNTDYADVLIGSTWATYAGTGVYETYSAVPAAATPIGNKYFLNGTTLWFKNSIVTTNAQSAIGFRSPNNDYADVLLGSTWVTYREGGGVAETYASVPATAKPLRNHYFLNGMTLYYKNTVVSSNVGSAAGYYGGDTPQSHADFVNFRDSGVCTV